MRRGLPERLQEFANAYWEGGGRMLSVTVAGKEHGLMIADLHDAAKEIKRLRREVGRCARDHGGTGA